MRKFPGVGWGGAGDRAVGRTAILDENALGDVMSYRSKLGQMAQHLSDKLLFPNPSSACRSVVYRNRIQLVRKRVDVVPFFTLGLTGAAFCDVVHRQS